MQRRWRGLAGLVGAVFVLAACATSGLYQARDGRSGYAETRLDATRWRVEFVGDDFTSQETVETYLLYRAAELTAESGQQWFAMPVRAIDEEFEIVVEVERPEAYRERYWQPKWRRRGRFFWSDLDPIGPMPHERREVEASGVSNSVHYSASAEIVMGNGPAPVGAFMAADTIVLLEASIVRPHT